MSGHEIDLGILSGSDPLLVTPDVRSQQSGNQLTLCLGEFGLQALTADEFMAVGVEEMNKSFVHACRAGVAFWATQEALSGQNPATPDSGVSTFKEWIKQHGLAEQRVYEFISIAKFYSGLPLDKRSQVFKIGKSKALLLASVPQVLMDEAVRSGRDFIDDADMMTVAELREEVRMLKKREANYNADIERKDMAIRRLTSARSKLTDFLPRTEDLRAECMAFQAGAELNIASLDKLFIDVASDEPTLAEHDLQVSQVWITANVIAARAFDLVQRMEDTFGPGNLPERVMGANHLTPAEAAAWLADWQTLFNKHEAEKAARETQREEARPKGPGRPRKQQG
jgi:hypothetical protein